MWSTVKMLPGSMCMCPGLAPGLLGWACQKQLRLSSNCLQSGVGQFHLSMHKWGHASRNCKCGTAEQITDHILIMCSIYQASHAARRSDVLDDKTQCWLNNITASIWSRQYSTTAAWGSKRINSQPQSCLCPTWSGCPSKWWREVFNQEEFPTRYKLQILLTWQFLMRLCQQYLLTAICLFLVLATIEGFRTKSN